MLMNVAGNVMPVLQNVELDEDDAFTWRLQLNNFSSTGFEGGKQLDADLKVCLVMLLCRRMDPRSCYALLCVLLSLGLCACPGEPSLVTARAKPPAAVCAVARIGITAAS